MVGEGGFVAWFVVVALLSRFSVLVVPLLLLVTMPFHTCSRRIRRAASSAEEDSLACSGTSARSSAPPCEPVLCQSECSIVRCG